jgi:hypothetical protein
MLPGFERNHVKGHPPQYLLARRWPRQRWAWLAGFLAIALVMSAVAWFQSTRTTSERAAPAMTTIPLTSYPGRELQPTFSPDCNQVAFVWNGENEDNYDIYVKVIDAPTPLRLTHYPAEDFSPAWSPDGQYIAFVRYSESKTEVLLVPVTGGRERKLYAAPFPDCSGLSSGLALPSGQWTPSGLSWSADSRFIAFSERISPQEPTQHSPDFKRNRCNT